MYIMGSDAWKIMVTENPANHMTGLAGMAIFSFIFYSIFFWFGEKV